jgi:signal transduction histidine kinase
MDDSQALSKKQRLYAEQVRQLYRQAPVGLLSIPIVSLIMVILLWTVIPHWILLTWYSAILLVAVPRYLLVVKFLGSSQAPAKADRWGTYFIIGAALSGIVWGSASFFLFPVNLVAHQFLIALMLGGMVAGAAGTYSVIMNAFLAYSLPTLVLLAVRFLLFTDGFYIGVGIVILVFESLMIVNAKRVNAAIVSSLEMRFENKDLVEKLTTQIERADGLNAKCVAEIAHRKRAEEALTQAHHQALEASRLKSRLLANVSHDLRSPLGSILGFTEMLQEGVYGPLSERQHTAMTDIAGSTEQLLNFVNNLLGQAQIESGKVVLNVKPFALNDLLETVSSTTKVVAQSKGLKLISEVAPDILPVTLSGDLYWLRQIVVNLVSNAVKFTDQGTVKIRAYRADENYWAIQVSDTGRGIPAEAQSYIFDSFRQVDETVTSEYQTGSGLGLSIVKQLTTLMGGKVTLTSEVGQGSTFTVLLPLTPVQKETI